MKTGTPHGSVISPTLANTYLHYVFDLWVDVWRAKCAQGDVVVVRYADDRGPLIASDGPPSVSRHDDL